MAPSLFVLGLLGTFSVIYTQAAIVIHPSCVGREAALNAGFREAALIAADAKQKLSENPMPWIASVVWSPMFSDLTDLPYVQSILGDVADLVNYTPLTITVFCNEDHLVFEGGDPQTSTTGHWMDPLYHNIFTGQPQSVEIPEPAADMQRLPRRRPLQNGKEAYVGYTTGVCADQAHLVLNTGAFNTLDPIFDRRSARDIVRDGLKPYPFNYLGNIMPLSRILLHELVHVAGGLTPENYPLIGDPAYGFIDCWNLRAANHLDPAWRPRRNADSFTMLALGIYLQIINPSGTPTYWLSGVVDPHTLRVIPSTLQTGSKRELSNLTDGHSVQRRAIQVIWVA